MRLIVGLGNVGAKYAHTRHNVGWLVVDALAQQAGATWRQAEQALVAEVRFDEQGRVGELGQKTWLVKPQTYMNASGKAVAPLMAFYRLPPEQLLVVQDDLDSPFGLLRLKPSGRHGGQNGVRDIIRLLGTEQFHRLKIGISRPPAGRDPADWVLSTWAPEEQATLQQLLDIGVAAAGVWAALGLAEAQARFNGTDLRPKPTPSMSASSAPAPEAQPEQLE